VAVTTTGSVGFVGLVVPHLVRLAIGNDQRVLLPAATLAGGALLVVADTLARTVDRPAAVAGRRAHRPDRRAGVSSTCSRASRRGARMSTLDFRATSPPAIGERTRVVSCLDLKLDAGERLAILGRNGAGKTTLLHTLAGLRAPLAGDVRLCGENCRRWRHARIAPVARRAAATA
jgi:ABC-type transport system involved in cytochrome bd biosynthesis fused ATPase/permease subunit